MGQDFRTCLWNISEASCDIKILSNLTFAFISTPTLASKFNVVSVVTQMQRMGMEPFSQSSCSRFAHFSVLVEMYIIVFKGFNNSKNYASLCWSPRLHPLLRGTELN